MKAKLTAVAIAGVLFTGSIAVPAIAVDGGGGGGTTQPGPGGTLKVLQIDGKWSPAKLLGNNGNSPMTPLACRTPIHTAGENEVAIVHRSATATTPNPVSDALYINAGVSKFGSPFQTMSLVEGVESMQDGTAHATTQTVIPLDAGVGYRFGAMLSSNSPTQISAGYCMGTVEIVKNAG